MMQRLTLCADEGKILTNGKEFAHMVNLYDGEIATQGEWREVEEDAEEDV